MSALSAFVIGMSAWLVLSLVWAALAAAVSQIEARRFEGWSSYWLAWLVIAVAPPLTAPIFFAAPLALAPVQLDAALALADWSAPVQRTGLELSLGVQALGIVFALALAGGSGAAFASLAANLRKAVGLRRRARPLMALDADADVLIADEATQIFCMGGARPSVIMSSAAAASMSPAQLRMVVDHELAHVRRGDPLLFALLCGVDALFWFNPFVRRLTDRVRLAAEISCDAIALEHRAKAARSAYAVALVHELEAGAGASAAVAAFGRKDMSRVRLAHILGGRRARRRRFASAALLIGACALFLPSAAVAASTVRMAAFGDATLLTALEARVADLYGAPRCGPDAGFSQQP